MRMDLFIASRMRPNPDLQRRLVRAGITDEEVRGVRDAATKLGLVERMVSPNRYRQVFGDPEIETGERWFYPMPLWPEHRFELVFLDGLVSLNGFLLRTAARIASQVRPVEIEEIRRLFRVGHHTSLVVAAVLGVPLRVDGWERMEDWHYRLESGTEITLEFDFELLGAII